MSMYGQFKAKVFDINVQMVSNLLFQGFVTCGSYMFTFTSPNLQSRIQMSLSSFRPFLT